MTFLQGGGEILKLHHSVRANSQQMSAHMTLSESCNEIFSFHGLTFFSHVKIWH